MNFISIILIAIGIFNLANGVSGLLFKVVYQYPHVWTSLSDFTDPIRFVRGKEAPALGAGYLILGTVTLIYRYRYLGTNIIGTQYERLQSELC